MTPRRPRAIGTATCSIDGCGRPRRALGMCREHYQNARRRKDSSLPRPCKVCGAQRPMDRRSYCSEECGIEGRRQREVGRAVTRTSRHPCLRCGGVKEHGVQGGRYCNSCREILAPVWQKAEADRGRARYLDKLDGTIKSGRRIARRQVDAPEGQKWCARCQQYRPLSAFVVSNGRPSSYCVNCQGAYNHERRMKAVFGIKPEQYWAMYDQQDGRCAICERKPRKFRLSVDHNHKTGEVRGLLCQVCNHRLLGGAKDSIDLLMKAVNYLEDPPARRVLKTDEEAS